MPLGRCVENPPCGVGRYFHTERRACLDIMSDIECNVGEVYDDMRAECVLEYHCYSDYEWQIEENCQSDPEVTCEDLSEDLT